MSPFEGNRGSSVPGIYRPLSEGYPEVRTKAAQPEIQAAGQPVVDAYVQMLAMLAHVGIPGARRAYHRSTFGKG